MERITISSKMDSTFDFKMVAEGIDLGKCDVRFRIEKSVDIAIEIKCEYTKDNMWKVTVPEGVIENGGYKFTLDVNMDDFHFVPVTGKINVVDEETIVVFGEEQRKLDKAKEEEDNKKKVKEESEPDTSDEPLVESEPEIIVEDEVADIASTIVEDEPFTEEVVEEPVVEESEPEEEVFVFGETEAKPRRKYSTLITPPKPTRNGIADLITPTPVEETVHQPVELEVEVIAPQTSAINNAIINNGNGFLAEVESMRLARERIQENREKKERNRAVKDAINKAKK